LKQIHATAIAIDAHAILIRGPSGCGKSDLALRMIDQGATLIADDRCDLDIRPDQVIVSSPDSIAGMIEIRGLGIIKTGAGQCAPVALIVDLVDSSDKVDIDRMPENSACNEYGPSIPIIRLASFEASTPAKIRMALAVAKGTLEKIS